MTGLAIEAAESSMSSWAPRVSWALMLGVVQSREEFEQLRAGARQYEIIGAGLGERVDALSRLRGTGCTTVVDEKACTL